METSKDEVIEIPNSLPKKKKEIRVDIQILRAISIILVLLYHLKVPRVSGGFIGVDMFFVISGYLVAGTFMENMIKNYDKPTNQITTYISFITRRIKRLTPASCVCLLLMLIGVYCSPIKVPNGLESVRYAALNYINIWLWSISSWYGADTSEFNVALHFWSLAVEWQFYFAFPIILILFEFCCQKIGLKVVVLECGLWVMSIISIATSFGLCFVGSESFRFYFLHTRLWEFVSGALVKLGEEPFSTIMLYFEDKYGDRVVDGFLKVIVVILMVALSVGGYFIPLKSWPGPWSLYVIGLTSVCILLGRKFEGNILTKPLILIGDWSYSIYLYHWPIIVFSKIFIISTGEAVADPFFWGACLFLTFCAALVSYYFVEKIGVWVVLKDLYWVGIFLFFMLLIPCLTLIPLRTYPLPPPVIANVTFNLNHDITSEEKKTLIQAVWNMDNACSVWFGEPGNCENPIDNKKRDLELVIKRDPKRCMFAVGDSHAQQFHIPWNFTAETYNASYYRMSKQCWTPDVNCFPDTMVNSLPIPGGLDECDSLLVLLGMWHYTYEGQQLRDWQDSMVRVATEYSKRGQVLIYRDFEWIGAPSSPVDCIRDNALDRKDITVCHQTLQDVTKITPKYDIVLQRLQNNENVGNIWLLPYLTTSNNLIYSYNYDYPVFQDIHHVSQDFNKRFTPSFLKLLENTTVVQKFVESF